MCPPFPPISMLTGVSAAAFANVGVFFSKRFALVFAKPASTLKLGGAGGIMFTVPMMGVFSKTTVPITGLLGPLIKCSPPFVRRIVLSYLRPGHATTISIGKNARPVALRAQNRALA